MNRPAIKAAAPLVLILLLGFGGALAWGHFHPDQGERHPGNPRDVPLTPNQKAAIQDRNHERQELAAEVARGDMTFEEAGCAYRRGEWDDEAERCSTRP